MKKSKKPKRKSRKPIKKSKKSRKPRKKSKKSRFRMKRQKNKKNKIRDENACEVWRTAAHKCFSERGKYLKKIEKLEREIHQQRSRSLS